MLVRRVNNTGEMSLEEFAARSNKSQVAAMSVAEQAVADGRRILEAGLLDAFFPDSNGNVLAASNADFYNAFLNLAGGSETYRNKDGSVRQNLSPRIKAAVLAAMLNPEKREVIERLLDNPEGYGALIGGLMQSAANVAELTQKPQYDISEELSQAVELYIEMHDKGQTVDEFAAQADMLREEPAPEVMFLCRLFEENRKTPGGISGVLKEYAAQCKQIDTTTVDLFGAEDPAKLEKLQAAYNYYSMDLTGEQTPRLKAKIDEVDARRFASELQDFIDGKLGDRHVFKLGTTPEVLRLLGIDDLPIELSASVLSLKLNEHPELNIEDLKFLPHEIANPIAVFDSQTVENSVIVLTELPSSKGNIVVAIHFDKRNNRGYFVHDIRSIHGRPDGQIINFVRNGRTRYVNTKRAPYWLRLPLVQFHGRNLSNKVPYGEKIFTESDLSQEEFNSFSSLKWKYDETRSPEELNAINKRHADLYERYKNGDMSAYKEAVELVLQEAENKGYITEGYHGTGADGFNVAKADASEARYGEGAQAHGPGLYMAANRDTAERYRRKGIKSNYAFEDGLFIFNSESEDPLYEIKNKDIIGSAHVYVGRKHVNDILSYIENNIKLNIELVEKLKENPKEALKDPFLYGYTNARKAIQDVKKSLKSDKSAYASLKKIMDSIHTENGDTSSYTIGYKKAQGRVFDWLHNMKPDEMFDEGKYLSEQPEVFEKYKEAWDEDIAPIIDERIAEFMESYRGVYDEESFARAAERRKEEVSPYSDNEKTRYAFDSLAEYLGADRFREIMLKHDIRGITYDGRQDGRAFVSFEGGATVKLQDPFTFDDDGNLIPLSERFNKGNPDMRFRIGDTEENLSKIINLDEDAALELFNNAKESALSAVKKGYSNFEAEKQKALEKRNSTRKVEEWSGDDDNGWARRIYYNGVEIIYAYKPEESADEIYLVTAYNRENEFDSLYEAENFAEEVFLEEEFPHREVQEGNFEHLEAFEIFKEFLRSILPESGIEFSEASSRLSESKYVEIEGQSGGIKIRFSDHVLPSKYTPSDFDVFSIEDLEEQLTDILDGVKYIAEEDLKEFKAENEENPPLKWRDVEENSNTKSEADKWANNPKNVKKLAKEYLAEQKGQIVVDPDRIRAKLPNYEISLNSDFVEAGDKVLEIVWEEALKRAPKDKPVVLLTGNPAAGKGTAKETGLLDWVVEANLVFDAPQNKFTSVEKRVKEAVDAGHSIRIVQIYNDPITSWRNSLERGIGKDNPETGKRRGGRFLPMEYFVRVYESAQGKVEKIETILKQKYQNKLETKYIDSTGNNPIVVSPDEAKAWDYSISDSQLKEIERITDEYRGRIEESARLRGDKKDPLAVIGRRVSQSLAISVRGSAERIPGRNEQNIAGAEQRLPGEGGEGRDSVSRLKALLRQERSENPVIWAGIVLSKEILLNRPITNAQINRLLPLNKFDGTKRNYAVSQEV